MIKNISILGSTGTIGLNSLKIFKRRKNKFKFNVFVADKNFALICNQIKIFKPKIFIVNNFKVYQNVKNKLALQRVTPYQSNNQILLSQLSQVSQDLKLQ